MKRRGRSRMWCCFFVRNWVEGKRGSGGGGWVFCWVVRCEVRTLWVGRCSYIHDLTLDELELWFIILSVLRGTHSGYSRSINTCHYLFSFLLHFFTNTITSILTLFILPTTETHQTTPLTQGNYNNNKPCLNATIAVPGAPRTENY